jgi:hypothetical protein
VAINDIMRAAMAAGRPRHHDGISGGRHQAGFESGGAGAFGEPIGGAVHVSLVRGLGGDAREAHVRAEFVDETGLVVFEVREDFFHNGTKVPVFRR